MDVGPFRASFWNHLVGFGFLTIVLLLMGSLRYELPSEAPIYSYLGGFLGVLFVAVNSYVLPRIGTTQTVLLVISGQMISGVLMEYQPGDAISTVSQFFGVAMILLGVYLARVSHLRRDHVKQKS